MAQQGTEDRQKQTHSHFPETPAQNGRAGEKVHTQQGGKTGGIGEKGIDGGGLVSALYLPDEGIGGHKDRRRHGQKIPLQGAGTAGIRQGQRHAAAEGQNNG